MAVSGDEPRSEWNGSATLVSMQPIGVSGDRGEPSPPGSEASAPYGGAFGLDRSPFAPEPDPRFHCETSTGRHALRFVQLALKQLSPVTLLVGGPGSGKTTLVQRLAKTVGGGLQMGILPPDDGQEDLFARLLLAFGQPLPRGRAAAREQLLGFVLDAYELGRASLLVVDDVHRMSHDDLKVLDRLTTARPPAFCPLILLLVGPLDLRDRLEASSLQALARRVEASTGIGRLSRSETAGYVRHRIAAAGGSTYLFGDDALELVHERTDGVPRAINALCDACLGAAAGEALERLDAAFVAAVPGPVPPREDGATGPRVVPLREHPPRSRATNDAGDGSPGGDAPSAAPAAAPANGHRSFAGAPLSAGVGADPAERLRALPGFLALVPIGREGDASAGADGEISGPARVVLDLARTCLGGSSAPIVAFASSAICLLDPVRALAVCGTEGFNLGHVLRHLRDLPEAAATHRPRMAGAAGFGTPWQVALWRLAEVVDRSVSPRRLVLETRDGTAAARIADGRIEAEDTGLAVMGAWLREATRRDEPARFALEPASKGAGRGMGADELLVEAGGAGRGDPAAPLLLDPTGWPLALPQGLGFDALSHAAAVARGLGACAGAGGGPPRVATLQGGVRRTVAQARADGWVEVDRAWLAQQVAEPAGGAR